MYDIFPFIPTWIHYATAIACTVHVLRSGRRGWWILLFFMVPNLGALVYFFMEWLPEIRSGRRLRPRNESNKKRIKRLREEMAHVDTVERRAQLAEAMLAEGEAEEAAGHLEMCDAGPYRDDPFILMSLIAAYLECEGRGQDAMAAMERLEATGSRDKVKLQALLKARSLAAAGRNEEAKAAYAKLGTAEGRCRYGLFLKSLGETELASQVFDFLLLESERATKIWQKAEKKWLDIAKAER